MFVIFIVIALRKLSAGDILSHVFFRQVFLGLIFLINLSTADFPSFFKFSVLFCLPISYFKARPCARALEETQMN